LGIRLFKLCSEPLTDEGKYALASGALRDRLAPVWCDGDRHDQYGDQEWNKITLPLPRIPLVDRSESDALCALHAIQVSAVGASCYPIEGTDAETDCDPDH
jgi:hypothetical protein